MATYPVKYIHEGMRGAPVLAGQPGTLIALLDAFLLTGFGVTTAVSVTVAGGIATATLPSGQSFEPSCVVLVEGATPAALNGEARVLTAGSASITWATTAPDGAASGTITIRVAPVGGWEKVYAASNKAVYRSADPQGSRFYYRIDDTGANHARLRGFETMADVDTGTEPFPTEAQIAGGGYWEKSYSSSGTAGYVLAADARTVLAGLAAGMSYGSTATASPLRGFGDMLALSPSGDPWCSAVSVSSGTSAFHEGSFDTWNSGSSGIYLPRNISGLGGAVRTSAKAYVGAEQTLSGADSSLGKFPSSVDGGLLYSRRFIRSSETDSTPRATLPGALHIPQSEVRQTVGRLGRFAGSGEFAGRTLLAVYAGNGPSYQDPQGVFFLDITGPWRPQP